MSCPLVEDLYRHPWPGQTHEEREELRAHAHGCEDCRATVDRLGSARLTLMADEPVFDRRRRAAVWEEIETQTGRAPFPLLPAAIVASAVVAVGLLVFRPSPSPPPLPSAPSPIGRAMVAKGPTKVRTPAVAVTAADGAQFTMVSVDLLDLRRGRVDVAVDAARAEPVGIETTAAKIEAVGSLSVEVEKHTTVEVRKGRARVSPAGGGQVDLGAGGRWSDEPAPPPAPKPEAPPPAARPRTTAEDLERAWTLVKSDAPKARQIATEVLRRRVTSTEEVDALALIADAYRRTGEHQRAADYYGKVASHAAGRGYAEEALLRRARQLLAVGDGDAAIDALDEAARRFPNGTLAPEIRRTKKRALEMKSAKDIGY